MLENCAGANLERSRVFNRAPTAGMLRLVTRLHALSLAALLLGACSKDSALGAKSDENADAKRGQDAPGAGSSDAAPLADDGKPLGRLSPSSAIDLDKIVHKTPAEVDAVLGEPTATGSDRISCVRFVPERVFFACEQEIRAYGHPDFESIRVEFEDGRAAQIALGGLPGQGEFTPGAALASVGVELPGEPHHDNPPLVGQGANNTVDRWEWGNAGARLLVDGVQFRVRLSVVNGEWARSKLEIINNNPLDADQEARIKQPRVSDPPAE